MTTEAIHHQTESGKTIVTLLHSLTNVTTFSSDYSMTFADVLDETQLETFRRRYRLHLAHTGMDERDIDTELTSFDVNQRVGARTLQHWNGALAEVGLNEIADDLRQSQNANSYAASDPKGKMIMYPSGHDDDMKETLDRLATFS